jgi:hypothetical protein
LDHIEVQCQTAKDGFVDAEPLHDLLSIVKDESGKDEDGGAGDEQVDVGAERQENLDKGCCHNTHEPCEKEWAKEVEVPLVCKLVFLRGTYLAYLGLESEQCETGEYSDGDEESLKYLGVSLWRNEGYGSLQSWTRSNL